MRAQSSADWIVAPAEGQRAGELAARLGTLPLVGQLLINRGLGDFDRAERYLAPRLGHLRRPDGDLPMAGFSAAVDRLVKALADKEAIGVFGDYDVDGVTSCALLVSFLRSANARTVPRVAKRDAGYGFGVADVLAFSDAGCALIVTCDCGTSDHDALAAARARNIDVIVVDHHQVPDRMPDALALINPHQSACQFPFKGLASVGVAFYLAAALRTRLLKQGIETLDPRQLLDLVAIGTVADMAPLADENRILVSAGLRELGEVRRAGLRALTDLVNLPNGVRRSSDIGMRIAPRLNAPGRLGDAQLALDLLLCDSPALAIDLVAACEQANKRRREIQERVLREALEQCADDRERGAVVVAGDGWHPGVVGIVAAKLVDRFSRPALVIALSGDEGRGSARTVAGFHLYDALHRSSDLLVRYGGHAAAGGFTIKRSNIAAFRDRMIELATTALSAHRPQLQLDAEIMLSDLSERLCDEMARLEPFGIANREPLFGVRGVALDRTRVVGDDHLQVTLRAGASVVDGIGFGFGKQAPIRGSAVRAAFLPEIDLWGGRRRVRIRLRDLVEE